MLSLQLRMTEAGVMHPVPGSPSILHGEARSPSIGAIRSLLQKPGRTPTGWLCRLAGDPIGSHLQRDASTLSDHSSSHQGMRYLRTPLRRPHSQPPVLASPTIFGTPPEPESAPSHRVQAGLWRHRDTRTHTGGGIQGDRPLSASPEVAKEAPAK